MEENRFKEWLKNPQFANALAIAAWIFFYFLCMLLPLVGPAGSRVEYASKNRLAFLTVLLLTMALAASASFLKMKRRPKDGALPYWSLGLCGICVMVFIILISGGFAI